MQTSKDVLNRLNELPRGQKINLVLSGGGIKGVAHLPLLEQIKARGLEINAISGTSAGAVVGSMFASGKQPQEILQFFIDHPLFRYSWIKPGKGGFFNTVKYINHFKDYIKPSFSELDFPVHICTTNLATGGVHYFHEGEDLLYKLIASCAVPGIYKAVAINGDLHADGGVMDNYPIHPFLKSDLPIIGSFVRVPSKVDSGRITSTRKVLKRSVHLQRYAIEIPKFDQTYLTVQQELDQFSAFRQKDASLIYDYTKKTYFS